eukprot:CAMPEP_0174248942 /NCGR_PEP_ID=MMETSP0417-20130205/43331_1 /TAXON_ID=242541 /ORGANISM="Mayorella sp, Strain BSH-02190019" /LENGTH=1031 /DNA_ID=CAMNT_0015328809 /DNA_START=16 /DNA_END=3107 /DNA_ORIENTATION=-
MSALGSPLARGEGHTDVGTALSAESLLQLLHLVKTTQENAVRSEANQRLETLARTPQGSVILLRVVEDASAPLSARLQCLVSFKSLVARHWQACLRGQWQSSGWTAAHVSLIHEALLKLLLELQEDTLTKHISHTLSLVGRPALREGMFPSLLGALSAVFSRPVSAEGVAVLLTTLQAYHMLLVGRPLAPLRETAQTFAHTLCQTSSQYREALSHSLNHPQAPRIALVVHRCLVLFRQLYGVDHADASQCLLNSLETAPGPSVVQEVYACIGESAKLYPTLRTDGRQEENALAATVGKVLKSALRVICPIPCSSVHARIFGQSLQPYLQICWDLLEAGVRTRTLRGSSFPEKALTRALMFFHEVLGAPAYREDTYDQLPSPGCAAKVAFFSEERVGCLAKWLLNSLLIMGAHDLSLWNEDPDGLLQLELSGHGDTVRIAAEVLFSTLSSRFGSTMQEHCGRLLPEAMAQQPGCELSRLLAAEAVLNGVGVYLQARGSYEAPLCSDEVLLRWCLQTTQPAWYVDENACVLRRRAATLISARSGALLRSSARNVTETAYRVATVLCGGVPCSGDGRVAASSSSSSPVERDEVVRLWGALALRDLVDSAYGVDTVLLLPADLVAPALRGICSLSLDLSSSSVHVHIINIIASVCQQLRERISPHTAVLLECVRQLWNDGDNLLRSAILRVLACLTAYHHPLPDLYPVVLPAAVGAADPSSPEALHLLEDALSLLRSAAQRCTPPLACSAEEVQLAQSQLTEELLDCVRCPLRVLSQTGLEYVKSCLKLLAQFAAASRTPACDTLPTLQLPPVDVPACPAARLFVERYLPSVCTQLCALLPELSAPPYQRALSVLGALLHTHPSASVPACATALHTVLRLSLPTDSSSAIPCGTSVLHSVALLWRAAALHTGAFLQLVGDHLALLLRVTFANSDSSRSGCKLTLAGHLIGVGLASLFPRALLVDGFGAGIPSEAQVQYLRAEAVAILNRSIYLLTVGDPSIQGSLSSSPIPPSCPVSPPIDPLARLPALPYLRAR